MNRPETMCIVAGGYSARAFNLTLLPGIVIGVNDSAYYSPRIDIAVSMDRLWSENRLPWLVKFGKPVYLRRSSIKAFRIGDHPHFVGYECDHRSAIFSDKPGTFNGTNSGAIALNLAYQMRPRQLYLLGFDMALGPRGERHWYPDYPWKSGGGSKPGTMASWDKELQDAISQLQRADIETVRVMPAPVGRSLARERLPSSGSSVPRGTS